MKLWMKILAGAIPAAALLLLLSFLLFRRHRRRQQQIITPQTPLPQISTKSKFNISHKSRNSTRNSLRFHHLNTNLNSTSSSSPLWAFCPTCDGGIQPKDSDLQTLRLNPGPKKTSDDKNLAFVRTNFPLPGPALAGSSFLQDAYFEITIIYLQQRKMLQDKVIRGNSISASLPMMFTPQDHIFSSENRKSGDVVVSLGLMNRASMSNQSMPGTFMGSIGFHSDGSVYLDGRKLVFESEKAVWADANKVIGCGFEPRKKKVFFTVDAQLVHVIRCSSDEYSSPLYPVMAADADTMIVVNLGQTPFKYEPANATRSQNPNFMSSATRMEAEWSEHGRRSKSNNNYFSSSSKKSNGYLDDCIDIADSDLFEISLQR